MFVSFVCAVVGCILYEALIVFFYKVTYPRNEETVAEFDIGHLSMSN